ncbi:unnamed protein product [Closterium sp. NIES-64]|nr:unnamed protein product [Closterium sp. NIES-64]
MVLHSWLVVLLEEEGGEQSSEPVMHVRGRSGRGVKVMVEDWSEWVAWQLERQLDALQQSLGVQIELLNLDPKDMVEDWSESVALLQLERQLGTLQQSVVAQIDLLNLDPRRYGGALEGGEVRHGGWWDGGVFGRELAAVQQSLGVQIELLNLVWTPRVRVVITARVSEGVSEWVAWQLDALQQSLGVQIELLNLGWSGGLEGAC